MSHRSTKWLTSVILRCPLSIHNNSALGQLHNQSRTPEKGRSKLKLPGLQSLKDHSWIIFPRHIPQTLVVLLSVPRRQHVLGLARAVHVLTTKIFSTIRVFTCALISMFCLSFAAALVNTLTFRVGLLRWGVRPSHWEGQQKDHPVTSRGRCRRSSEPCGSHCRSDGLHDAGGKDPDPGKAFDKWIPRLLGECLDGEGGQGGIVLV